MIKIFEAMNLARERHQWQVRKLSGTPYFNHLAEVAALAHVFGLPESYVMAAWLHDITDDTITKSEEITALFGFNVSTIVYLMSDPQAHALHTTHHDLQTLKCCDIISNTADVRTYIENPKWGQSYLAKKWEQVAMMTKANERARAMAFESIKKAQYELDSSRGS